MLRRRRAQGRETAGHVESDILCANEAGAREEAARQQATETEGAEWIYLRRDRDKQWVARRWTGQGDGPEPKRTKFGIAREVIAELLNPTNW